MSKAYKTNRRDGVAEMHVRKDTTIGTLKAKTFTLKDDEGKPVALYCENFCCFIPAM